MRGGVCFYQKDGPGNLRRMYVDRVRNPKIGFDKKELVCRNGHVLGIRIVYEKENRTAYRLFVDAIIKKVVGSSILLKDIKE